jgi:hypothetical protein
MIGSLIKLATHLDNKGLAGEADYLDAIIKNNSQEIWELTGAPAIPERDINRVKEILIELQGLTPALEHNAAGTPFFELVRDLQANGYAPEEWYPSQRKTLDDDGNIVPFS